VLWNSGITLTAHSAHIDGDKFAVAVNNSLQQDRQTVLIIIELWTTSGWTFNCNVYAIYTHNSSGNSAGSYSTQLYFSTFMSLGRASVHLWGRPISLCKYPSQFLTRLSYPFANVVLESGTIPLWRGT
jgi:hypothetical protein